MQTLKEGAGSDVDWESRREERRAYIESGVRRVVGTRRSEGKGMGGELRSKEEVEGLEDLVRDQMEVQRG